MDLEKWVQMPEAKIKGAEAQVVGWVAFTGQFLNADKSKFFTEVPVIKRKNLSTEIFFKESPGSLQNIFGSDRKYWSEEMKKHLEWPGPQ